MQIYCKKIFKKTENWVPKFVFAVNCRTNMLKVYSKDNGEYLVFRNVYCIQMYKHGFVCGLFVVKLLIYIYVNQIDKHIG